MISGWLLENFRRVFSFYQILWPGLLGQLIVSYIAIRPCGLLRSGTYSFKGRDEIIALPEEIISYQPCASVRYVQDIQHFDFLDF